jgi:hypothetical protein
MPPRETAPPRRHPVGPWPALLRHPLLALFIVAVCTAAGVAAGMERTPVYRTEARMAVGNIDVESQALPGYVSAVESLAGSYSRAVDSNTVVEPVARELGMSRSEVARRVSASPVPASAVIRVSATGADEESTVRLANATADSLRAYVAGLDSGSNSSRSILREYRKASLEAEEARETREQQREAAGGSPETSERVQEAEAEYSAASLRVRSLANQYQQTLQQRPPANFVRKLTDASVASNDRMQQIQLRGFTGFVAGLVLAAAVVTALANRRRRGG